MKTLRYDPKSIRSGLTLVTLLCWILPILIIVTMFSVLVNYYNDRNLEQAMDLGMENAMQQVELRLLSVIEDSKAVSYDGIVRQSYSESRSLVYKDVTEYLTQKFTRNANYRCVFISSVGGDEPVHAYAAAPGTARLNLLRDYKARVYPEVQALLERVDTGIYFLTVDDEIYMVRNLLDHDFTPYAMLVLGLEKSEVFQSLYGIANVAITGVSIDGAELPVAASEAQPAAGGRQYPIDCDGHTLLLTAQSTALRPLSTMPMLRWAIAGIALLGIPLSLLVALIFNRSVNRPMEVLLDANRRVENGERGYVITAEAPNTEFRHLYSQFNAMSSELKSQFERLYLEQQALQQAKIRALQSQINPHFLNNTLEIINWEARLADNERVCSMIEALSTMLDAAIGRDGRAQIPLAEELQYVDAYLYITKERLGDRLTLRREIDEAMLPVRIPRLMLQLGLADRNRTQKLVDFFQQLIQVIQVGFSVSHGFPFRRLHPAFWLRDGPEVAVRTAVTACRSSPELCPLPTRLSLPLPVLSSGPFPGPFVFGFLPYSFGLIILYHIWDVSQYFGS